MTILITYSEPKNKMKYLNVFVSSNNFPNALKLFNKRYPFALFPHYSILY